jgi:hypothetical protein
MTQPATPEARIADLERQVQALTERVRRADAARMLLLGGLYSINEYLDVVQRGIDQGRDVTIEGTVRLIRIAYKQTMAQHARTYEPRRDPQTS